MQESVMQRMWESAHLSGGNAAYVEELYELYLHDPNAVPEEWRTYFQNVARRRQHRYRCIALDNPRPFRTAGKEPAPRPTGYLPGA
ncbi:2-oxoglutarate dehydrogenase E1 component [Pseudomonas putida S11]|nr:2-oxoglutarate dehydrogenase E1 component [Pseudomonas putida S11]